MKGVKGRFLKKLKTIKPIISLKQIHDRVLQLNASNGFLNPFNQTNGGRQEDQMNHHCNPTVLELDMVDDVYDELITRELEDEEMEFGDTVGNKENTGPGPSSIKLKDPSMSLKENTENLILLSSDLGSFNHHRKNPLSDLNGSSFRCPDSMFVKGNSETPRHWQYFLSEMNMSYFSIVDCLRRDQRAARREWRREREKEEEGDI